MNFDIHILGCGSAKPTPRHKPSCQVVDIHSKLYMIDCGEGAQIEFSHQGLSLNKLRHIFVSHNHGDHVFGLPGLISTMALLGRTAELHIHGPQDMAEFLQMILKTFCEGIAYEVIFHPVNTKSFSKIYEDRTVEVWSLPLDHRIPCCGYQFREKAALPHIRREMIDAFNIPVSQINNIKAGASWTIEDGTVIPFEKLTTPATPPRIYSYCSDTAYKPDLIPLIEGSNLLFHEATYPQELEFRAIQTRHTTTVQAAQIARDAKVGKLCIGHFSARIREEAQLLKETRPIFANTILANEGLVLKI